MKSFKSLPSLEESTPDLLSYGHRTGHFQQYPKWAGYLLAPTALGEKAIFFCETLRTTYQQNTGAEAEKQRHSLKASNSLIQGVYDGPHTYKSPPH